MNILFWLPYPTEGASNRYRVEQYLPYLDKSGIKYTLHSFWSSAAYRVLYKEGYQLKKAYYFLLGAISRISDLINISQYDAVFIHREAFPIGGAFFEAILHKLGKPFIFDFDDAIFLSSTSKPNSFIERLKNPNKTISIIRFSDHVIAGNSYLANFALGYNRSVSVIPTAIDTDKYQPALKKANKKIIIGWIGSVTTIDFLYMLRNVFIQLSERFHNVVFKIVGPDFSLPGLSNIVNKPWKLEEEIEDLGTFDIGIMPMPDNKWTRGKCGFKAILYMSLGIPCVCSPIGVNTQIVDGINGFLAVTEEEWLHKLSLLIKSPELRKEVGQAGRKTMEERYSVRVNAPKFLEIIQESVSKK